VVEVLLDHGGFINDPGGDHCDGITPLHDAAVNGQAEVVQLLLERGVDVTIVDKKVILVCVSEEACHISSHDQLSGSASPLALLIMSKSLQSQTLL